VCGIPHTPRFFVSKISRATGVSAPPSLSSSPCTMQKGRVSHALGARRSLGAYKRRGRKMRNRTHDDGVAPGWKRALVNALRCVLRLTVVFGPLSLPLLMKTDSVIAARASAPAFGWVRQQNKDKHVHERTHNDTHTNTHTHTHTCSAPNVLHTHVCNVRLSMVCV